MNATQVTTSRKERKAEERKWRDFSADDLIDAYREGKQKGRDELFSILDETISRNLEKAFKQSERLFAYLEDNTKVTPQKVFMRVESPTEFCSLLLIPESDYASDEMLEVMKEAKSRELDLREKAFELDFSFMSLSENTSEEAILADGFSFSYPEEDE